MNVSSSSANFADTVAQFMEKATDDFKNDIDKYIQQSIDETAKEAVKRLKAESPKSSGPGGGKYAKGWAVQKERGRMTYGAIIYGKSGTYQLAHLLEKSHAKRGGGRTTPIVHIAPVEEWAAEEAVNKFIDKVEQMN